MSAERVLVCGGRNYADRTHVFSVLDKINADRGVSVLIHGGATGADAFAGQWSRIRKVARLEYSADWKKLGRRAGPVRNEEMLRSGLPTLVVAFPGGRGTAHMVEIAKRDGVPVLDLREPRP